MAKKNNGFLVALLSTMGCVLLLGAITRGFENWDISTWLDDETSNNTSNDDLITEETESLNAYVFLTYQIDYQTGRNIDTTNFKFNNPDNIQIYTRTYNSSDDSYSEFVEYNGDLNFTADLLTGGSSFYSNYDCQISFDCLDGEVVDDYMIVNQYFVKLSDLFDNDCPYLNGIVSPSSESIIGYIYELKYEDNSFWTSYSSAPLEENTKIYPNFRNFSNIVYF